MEESPLGTSNTVRPRIGLSRRVTVAKLQEAALQAIDASSRSIGKQKYKNKEHGSGALQPPPMKATSTHGAVPIFVAPARGDGMNEAPAETVGNTNVIQRPLPAPPINSDANIQEK